MSKTKFDLTPNLTFQGASGIEQINGLTICYLSGLDSDLFIEGKSKDYIGNYFDNTHFDNLISKFQSLKLDCVDMLICSTWPVGIKSSIKYEYYSSKLSFLIKYIKP